MACVTGQRQVVTGRAAGVASGGRGGRGESGPGCRPLPWGAPASGSNQHPQPCSPAVRPVHARRAVGALKVRSCGPARAAGGRRRGKPGAACGAGSSLRACASWHAQCVQMFALLYKRQSSSMLQGQHHYHWARNGGAGGRQAHHGRPAALPCCFARPARRRRRLSENGPW